MRILVTNDDGILSPGIELLAAAARPFGEVTVIAPRRQCSAMSRHITLGPPMHLKEQTDFPIEGVKAWSYAATPTDCVRSALRGLYGADEEPELVLSGINDGANCGFDVMYSATVGAAMEAVSCRIPAICFSQARANMFESFLKYSEAEVERVRAVLRDVLENYMPENEGEVVNVNLPAVKAEEVKGTLYDRFPSQQALFRDRYIKTENPEGGFDVTIQADFVPDAEEGSDIRAIFDGYVSVGRLKSEVVCRTLYRR